MSFAETTTFVTGDTPRCPAITGDRIGRKNVAHNLPPRQNCSYAAASNRKQRYYSMQLSQTAAYL
jgi:hypothetical protein